MGLFSNIARDGSSTPFSQAPPGPPQHGGYGPPGGGYVPPPPVQARGGYGERESSSHYTYSTGADGQRGDLADQGGGTSRKNGPA